MANVNIALIHGRVESIGRYHFHHMLVLFIAPPDDDAKPYSPKGNKEEYVFQSAQADDAHHVRADDCGGAQII